MMGEMLIGTWRGVEPIVPMLIALVAVLVLLRAPLPGRGPRGRRDQWRSFKYSARRDVMDRAGGRCEAAMFIVWGRCSGAATDADHVYPWSRGGPTIVSNGQALCREHNTRKGALAPPWWYVLGLERRRRSYFPPGARARVSARMSDDDRRLRG